MSIEIIGEASDRRDKMSEAEVRANEAAKRSAGKTHRQVAEESGLLVKEIRAKYKIEVTFDAGRTLQGPNVVGIHLWESGKRLHGGGDELMFFCKDSKKGSDLGCWGPISQDNIKGPIAYCPNCQKALNADRLTDMKIGKVTSQNLAIELAKLFRQLGSNADIYIKYHKTDVRYAAMEKAKGPDVAARLKGMHIYPLKNILKDTSAGADIVKRFHAFITS
jgi:hypothetical protein